MWKQGNGLLMKDVARDSIIFVAFGWNIFVHKLLQEMDHFILSWGGANYQKEILAQDKATQKKSRTKRATQKKYMKQIETNLARPDPRKNSCSETFPTSPPLKI